jgi:hypothetical protein
MVVVLLPKALQLASKTRNNRVINLLSAVGKVANAVVLSCLKALHSIYDCQGTLKLFA